MAKILAKKGSFKFTDEREYEAKLKRQGEYAKLSTSNSGFERSATNSGSNFLAKHKISSTSHTSNANESTLPLTNQWDSTLRDQKLEKELRSNSVTGRNIAQLEEELRAQNSKNAKQKTDGTKIFPNTHREGSESNTVKDSTHISEKLLAYLKLQSPQSKLSSTFAAYCSPVLQRKISFAEKAGFKPYKTKGPLPASTKNNGAAKQSKPLHPTQVHSTKNSARGKNSKKIQESVGNFSARNIETKNQAENTSSSQIFPRKLSEQCEQILINTHDVQLLSRPGELASPSIRNTIKGSRKKLSNTPKLQEFVQSNKNTISKKITDSSGNGKSPDVQEFRGEANECEKLSKEGAKNQLLGLLTRIDSIFMRYEREELVLKRKNEYLLQLLDKKIAEKHAREKRK